MTFESIHDMPYPIEALQKMRDVVSPDGAMLIGDVSMKETLEKNDFVGKLYYNFSVLLCLPQLIDHANSVATGAAMTSSTFKKYAIESGFQKLKFYQSIISYGHSIVLHFDSNFLIF